MPSFTIDINFQINTDALSEAEESLQSLRESAEETEVATEEITGDGISEMGESASETAENIKQASESMEELGSKTEETSEKMQETAESSAGIGTALVGIGGAVGLDAIITKADNINTSWNKLSLTFEGTGVSMDTLKAKSSELTSATGRSGTQVRDYFNQMGIAGITNVDLLSTSFENMAGRAYQTGSSVESMESSVQRMVMSGNAGAKMLSNLGISSGDLAEALGVTEDQIASTFKEMSTTERLEALNKAMGDGTEANEMYKNSYEGLKQQSSMAIGSLMSSIGQSILPVVIPAIKGATDVIRGFADIWKGLPAQVTSVFGVLGGGIVAITTLTGTLGVLGKVGSSVFDGLKSLKDGYKAVKDAMGTAKAMTDALRNAESISQGVRSALAIATGVEATAEEGNTIAKTSAIAPTEALATAEGSLLLPILLVVGAIVGLIAILYYLYNNNEQVKQGIDGLIASVKGFVSNLVALGQAIVQAVLPYVQQFFDSVMNIAGAIVTAIIPIVQDWFNRMNMIIQIITSLIQGNISLQDAVIMIWTIIQDTITTVTTAILNWIGSFGQFLYTAVSNAFNNVLNAIISAVQGWYNSTIEKATSIVDGVYNALSVLPTRVSDAINGVKEALTKPFEDAWNSIKPIVEAIENGVDTLNDINPFSSFEFEGFGTGSIGYEGFDTLNSAVSNSTSNNSANVTNNFNINGIIEEEASQYIVNSVNGYIKKQNLVRGV